MGTAAQAQQAEKTRHERRRERTRQSLLAATESLLIERGFEAFAIGDITDAADLARATFYVHFRDKEEAVWEVMRARFADLETAVAEDRAAQDEPLEVRRRRKWARLFTFAAEHRDLLHAITGAKGYLLLSRRLVQYLAEIAERDQASGFAPVMAGQPRAVEAQFVAGALVQTLTWWLEHDTPYSAEQMAEMVYVLTAGRADEETITR